MSGPNRDQGLQPESAQLTLTERTKRHINRHYSRAMFRALIAGTRALMPGVKFARQERTLDFLVTFRGSTIVVDATAVAQCNGTPRRLQRTLERAFLNGDVYVDRPEEYRPSDEPRSFFLSRWLAFWL